LKMAGDAIQNDYLIIIYNYFNFRFLTGQPLFTLQG